MSKRDRPTAETYSALQTAYEFFNRYLFCGHLPDCLITPQRRDKRMYGYFWGSRFTHLEDLRERLMDKIALNPRRFTAAGDRGRAPVSRRPLRRSPRWFSLQVAPLSRVSDATIQHRPSQKRFFSV
jgi:hypothetical protein